MIPYTDQLHTFSKALLGDTGSEAQTTRDIGGDILPPEARLFIHKNHRFVTLKAVLKATFNTVSKLVDDRFFDYMAHGYVTENPPKDPRISVYGADFPEYLAAHDSCTSVPFLASMARLDWEMADVARADVTSPLAPLTLSALSENALGTCVFVPRPCMRVLQEPVPLHGIWCFAHGLAEAPPDMTAAESVLITRENGKAAFEVIPQQDAAFVSHLMHGLTLEDAAEKTATAHQDFDLATSLGWALSAQIFQTVVTTEAPSRPS